MSRARDIAIHYPKHAENGTYRYQLSVDGVKTLTSIRSFLTYQEAAIEAEWLLNKLGMSFVKPKTSSPSDR